MVFALLFFLCNFSFLSFENLYILFLILLFILYVAAASAKVQIWVVEPAIGKNEISRMVSKTFYKEVENRDFCRVHNGALYKDNVQLSYPELEAGNVYILDGPIFRALLEDKVFRKSENKALEFEAAMAVENSLGSSAHMHLNVQDYIKPGCIGSNWEIDGVVVHDPDEHTTDATAYVIETANAP